MLGGYPLALSALPARPWRSDDARLPSVSLLVPRVPRARGAAPQARALRELDYPRERIEVIVLADEDRELARVAREARPDALVLFEPERGGKAAGLNRGAAHATGGESW